MSIYIKKMQCSAFHENSRRYFIEKALVRRKIRHVKNLKITFHLRKHTMCLLHDRYDARC